MIRINLARNQNTVSAGTQTAVEMDYRGISTGPHPLLKVSMMLIFVVGLYFYSDYVVTRKKTLLLQVNEQASQIQKEGEALGSITNVVRELSTQKSELNKQLEVIRQISQKRAYKLETIRFLQNQMPNDLWIKEILMSQDKINFKGYSRSPFSIQKFVEDLSSRDYIEDALNKELSRERVEGEELNTFDIEAQVRQQ